MIDDREHCAFRVLGPVEVVVDGTPLRWARRQQRDLLAFLLLRTDRIVSTGEIIEAMWGGAAPRTAHTQVQNMLSGLRSALRDGAQTLAGIERHSAGYRLRISAGRLDLATFTELTRQAGRASDGAAAPLLRQALGLWHGEHPLAGVQAPFATGARAYLTEQRDSALEQLFDAELGAGNHAATIPALTDAVAGNPTRQRFVAQLMLALHRSGRVTDALHTYRQARANLAEQYGLEVSRELAELERQILRDDPTLQAPAVIQAPPAAATTVRSSHRPDTLVPAQLPIDVRGFAGRQAELALLDGLVSDGSRTVVTLLMGTAGVGKTALAVHWGHRVADRFPDGQLYVDLRGVDASARPMDPAQTLRSFLTALGVPADQAPSGLDEQAALFRSLVAGRRILVLLDNALDADQVRPLLPGTSGGLVLITSRHQLTSLVAREGAHPVTLGVMSEREARELLEARLGRDRVSADLRATDDIATRCARLPLALAMVAARAAIHTSFPLRTLSAELTAVRGRLAPAASDPLTADIQATFSWSYRRLSPAAARLFRLLGLHPGPHVGIPAAASLAGTEPGHASRLLTELVHAHLITEHLPGRYALHDLLRDYGAELALRTDSGTERQAALRRVLAHYLHSSYAAALVMYPHRYRLELTPAEPASTVLGFADYEQALDWFTTEHPVLLAALNCAAEHNLSTHVWQLASALSTYLDRCGHWHDWLTSQRTALAVAAGNTDATGQAHAHGSLGLAYNRLKQLDQAQSHLHEASELFGNAGDLVGQAYTELRLSLVFDGQGDQQRALHHARQALDRFDKAAHPVGVGQALNNTGWLHAQLGQYTQAVAHCQRAVEVHRSLDDMEGVANALDSLGFAHHSLGDHSQAIECYRQALIVLRQLADPYYETITLTHVGDTHLAAGDPAAATSAWRQALELLDELRHADAAQLRAKLAQLDFDLDV